VEDVFLKVPNYYTLPIFPFFLDGEYGRWERREKLGLGETKKAEPFPTLPFPSHN
jgi:hypothetical protein